MTFEGAVPAEQEVYFSISDSRSAEFLTKRHLKPHRGRWFVRWGEQRLDLPDHLFTADTSEFEREVNQLRTLYLSRPFARPAERQKVLPRCGQTRLPVPKGWLVRASSASSSLRLAASIAYSDSASGVYVGTELVGLPGLRVVHTGRTTEHISVCRPSDSASGITVMLGLPLAFDSHP